MVRARFTRSIVVLLSGVLLIAGCGREAGMAGPAARTGSATTPNAPLDDGRYASPAADTSATGAIADPAAAASPPSPRYREADTSRSPVEAAPGEGIGPGQGGDEYAYLEENEFLPVKDAPLSTFSIDVDTASYSKTRSYLLEHHTLPPPDAVRIEELVNYFDYAYAGPTDEHPFAVHIETAECPWQPAHRLVRFGIQGKRLERERPVSNLVFLIDVSGSMNAPNKLGLVQDSLSLLARQLGENDQVAIVVYAGAAGLVLQGTSGSDQRAILYAIDNLRAGGSTNGGEGIHLAYQVARENFVKGGVNRVLLCTDGDFNVGTTSSGDLVRLVQAQAKEGIYLTVLGFGFGNHNDAMLEDLSNKANGNYAFIDSRQEAAKVLARQLQGTLVTIAKDVKIQVEFNPLEVAAYRLIGYENRRLADRDFNDDTKDAGDIGAGHSVTALYEIVPPEADSELARSGVDPLKYQESGVGGQESGIEGQESSIEGQESSAVGNALRGVPGERGDVSVTEAAKSGELLTLKLRYQPPDGGQSTLMTFPVMGSGQKFGYASADFQFAASVASFGMLLRGSKHRGDTSLAAVLETASAALGEDKHGLRAEFLELVRAAQQLSRDKVGVVPPAWNVPRRHVIIGAPHVTTAANYVRPNGTTAAPMNLFGSLRTELVLALGIAIGGLVSLVTIAACICLLRLRGGAVSYAEKPAKTK